jgi:tetratricopeptide (TPR) repeat protein
MSTFQLFLLLLAGSVFYLFFKQLFSGSFPKRGVDFEAKKADEQIGGINRPDKTFSKPKVKTSRIEQLLTMTDEAIEKADLEEAKKALGSALILEKDNIEVIQKMAYVYMQTEEYMEAVTMYKKLLESDDNDDMAHAMLANALHKLKDEDESKKHHKRSIELDSKYAPHHFNYANTLYDLDEKHEALLEYKKAFELDNSLDVAKEMIVKLENSHV